MKIKLYRSLDEDGRRAAHHAALRTANAADREYAKLHLVDAAEVVHNRFPDGNHVTLTYDPDERRVSPVRVLDVHSNVLWEDGNVLGDDDLLMFDVAGHVREAVVWSADILSSHDMGDGRKRLGFAPGVWLDPCEPAPISAPAPLGSTVHVLEWGIGGNVNTSLHASHDAVLAEKARIARAYWKAERESFPGAPTTPPDDDAEVVRIFFGTNEDIWAYSNEQTVGS